jgi:GTP-binding protein
MIIKSSTFVTSAGSLAGCPPPSFPEFAFIGRSNVGKSSLINMLAGRKDMARTSVKPGKTQTINHYLINNRWYLVDLPGYGYASVGKTTKSKWPAMISSYLLKRTKLTTTFVLLDIRLEPQAIDKDFISWAGQSGIPFAIAFTKSDKLSRSASEASVRKWRDELSKTWSELPPMFATSAAKRTGGSEILDYIDSLLKVSEV